MNGRDMLLAFADLDGKQLEEACDIESARQSFRAYETRRKKTLGAMICCFVAVSAAVGVGYRGIKRKMPTVPPTETGGVSRSNGDSAGQDAATAASPVATSSTAETTLPEPEASKPSTTEPGFHPPATAPPSPTVSGVVSETAGAGNITEQTETAAAPTTVAPATEPPTQAPPIVVIPTTDPPTQTPPTEIIPITEPPTQTPPTSAPTTAAEPAPSSDSPEIVAFEKYVFRIDGPEYADYLPGKVIENEKVGAIIGRATATAGWQYADGSMSATESLRCELFEITGVDRTVAICVRFTDRGEALTTDHFYVLYDPCAELFRVSDYTVPTTVPNNEE